MIVRLALLAAAASVIALAVPSAASLGIGPVDLCRGYAPTNPITTWGKVTSTAPVRISDGSGQIEVTGLSGLRIGDYVVLEGTWNGESFSANRAARKARAYRFPSGTEMLYVAAGTLYMGNNGSEVYCYPNELPRHAVHLSAYWIGKHEVTRGEYRRFMEAGGYASSAYWSSAGWQWKVANNRSQPSYWSAAQDWRDGCGICNCAFSQTDRHPVIGVSYYEAEAFCKWAGGYLPTEAQWEKAARQTFRTATFVYPWGNTWSSQYCNNLEDIVFPGYQTTPAGSYPSGESPFGCLDMAGNAFEWCSDWYSAGYYSQPPEGGWRDPQGPASGMYRVLRGGSWSLYANNCRAAYRGYAGPANVFYSYGFRLVCPGG